MKRKLVALMVTALAATMIVGCGNKDANKQDDNTVNVEQSVQESVDVKKLNDALVELGVVAMPMEATEEEATEVFHLDLDKVESYAITQEGRSPGAGFIVLVNAKDGQVDAVKESVEAILADKVASAFYPFEKELAESAEVKVNGNLVSLIIADESVQDAVNETFNSMVK